MKPSRLFLGLDPSPPVREALAHHAESLGRQLSNARVIPADNLHLTVVFVGETRPTARDALASWLGDFVCPAFDLHLVTAGRFARAGVVWVGPATVPSALSDLQAAAQAAVTAYCPGTTVDEAREFRPHVTLLRTRGSVDGINDKPLDPPLAWPVRRLTLFESTPVRRGVRYRRVAESREAV